MEALAFAKVNLSLRVGRIREDGFHPLRSLFQSVSLADRVTVEFADADQVESASGGPVVADLENLAWLAVVAVRNRAGSSQPIRVRLAKRIPVAAGLGGGSADAAAALGLAGRLLGVDGSGLADLAPGLGSDVPFCLHGGLALVTGRGEEIAGREASSGYALGIVVPPVELATPAVYARWDAMGEPSGPHVNASGLPPSLRPEAPLVNDLYPAAVSLAPELDDWRASLSSAWSRPVLMSGSGPSLYGLFIDQDEALDALEVVPRGARSVEAAQPVPFGWLGRDDPWEGPALRGGRRRISLDSGGEWAVAVD